VCDEGGEGGVAVGEEIICKRRDVSAEGKTASRWFFDNRIKHVLLHKHTIDYCFIFLIVL
jgi:hypothetical protein